MAPSICLSTDAGRLWVIQAKSSEAQLGHRQVFLSVPIGHCRSLAVVCYPERTVCLLVNRRTVLLQQPGSNVRPPQTERDWLHQSRLELWRVYFSSSSCLLYMDLHWMRQNRQIKTSIIRRASLHCGIEGILFCALSVNSWTVCQR